MPFSPFCALETISRKKICGINKILDVFYTLDVTKIGSNPTPLPTPLVILLATV